MLYQEFCRFKITPEVSGIKVLDRLQMSIKSSDALLLRNRVVLQNRVKPRIALQVGIIGVVPYPTHHSLLVFFLVSRPSNRVALIHGFLVSFSPPLLNHGGCLIRAWVLTNESIFERR